MSDVVLCRLDTVPDGGARVLAVERRGAEERVVIVRRGEQAWAYVNRCPHFSVGLDFIPNQVLTYEGAVMMCAHHSALFRFDDGVCIDGPCSGAGLEAVTVEVDSAAWVICRGA